MGADLAVGQGRPPASLHPPRRARPCSSPSGRLDLPRWRLSIWSAVADGAAVAAPMEAFVCAAPGEPVSGQPRRNCFRYHHPDRARRVPQRAGAGWPLTDGRRRRRPATTSGLNAKNGPTQAWSQAETAGSILVTRSTAKPGVTGHLDVSAPSDPTPRRVALRPPVSDVAHNELMERVRDNESTPGRRRLQVDPRGRLLACSIRAIRSPRVLPRRERSGSSHSCPCPWDVRR